MYEAKKIANQIFFMYREKTGVELDQMKLHKLMYYAQKESFICTGEPLFSNVFRAWKYGPVLPVVRQMYFKKSFSDRDKITESYVLDIIRTVLDKYGSISSWELSEMSHKEISWIKARKGVPEGKNSDNKMSNDDILFDAEIEKLIREDE